MKLIERDGKTLLREAGVQTPPGVFCPLDTVVWPADQPWPGPVLIKSQVLQGRRGASGLILRADAVEDVPAAFAALRERLGHVPCAGFLCEPVVNIAQEWFLAVDVDRTTGRLRASVSAAGGMDVQEARTFPVEALDTQALPDGVADAVRRVIALARDADATHLEINPFVQTRDGQWIALDAKVELDDAAAARHPEWSAFYALSPFGRALTEGERAYEAFLATAGHRGTFGRYVELDGDIALILSGGGASLVALDGLSAAGGRAANYLEASGNPDPDVLRQAAAIVLSKPGIRGLWVAGSFANFTDIQATCAAILQAMDDVGLRLPIVIRRDGPNADAAVEACARWAAEQGIAFAFHRADMPLEASAAHLLTLINL